MIGPKELDLGIHAGDAETSLMLSILPQHVKMAAAIAEYPQTSNDRLLSFEGKLPFAWVTRDLTNSGVIGDPTVAMQAKGDHLLASLADSWVEVIKEIYTFRQPQAGRPSALESERLWQRGNG